MEFTEPNSGSLIANFDNPPGAADIAHAAIAAMPNGTDQVAAVTAGGQVKHHIRFPNGSWQPVWGIPAQTSPFTQASIAATANGTSEIVGVTEGGLKFDVRYPDGS